MTHDVSKLSVPMCFFPRSFFSTSGRFPPCLLCASIEIIWLSTCWVFGLLPSWRQGNYTGRPGNHGRPGSQRRRQRCGHGRGAPAAFTGGTIAVIDLSSARISDLARSCSVGEFHKKIRQQQGLHKHIQTCITVQNTMSWKKYGTINADSQEKLSLFYSNNYQFDLGDAKKKKRDVLY